MADEPRFDWPAILRVVGIITAVSAVIGFGAPIVFTLVLSKVNTGPVAGSQIYRLVYWLAAWALMFWQGQWMLNTVGDKIIDDMLVTSVIIAVLMMVIMFVVWIVYVPVNAGGQPIVLTGFDAIGAVGLLIIGVVAARINRY